MFAYTTIIMVWWVLIGCFVFWSLLCVVAKGAYSKSEGELLLDYWTNQNEEKKSKWNFVKKGGIVGLSLSSTKKGQKKDMVSSVFKRSPN